MKFLSLKIQEGFFEKEIDFNHKFNLIFSKKNSVGKTTLLRCLLYSMGFNVPNTKNLKMEQYSFSLELINDSNIELLIKRNDSYCNVLIKNTNEQLFYSLPSNSQELHQLIFCSNNSNIIENILGTMYLDQEKGWTLLNRGKVIGSIQFNLHKFIQGVSNVDCSELYEELNYIENQIDKYTQILSVASYKEQISKLTKTNYYDSQVDEIEKKVAVLEFEKQPLKIELNRLNEVLNKNTAFKKYITSMQIYVLDKNGNHIPVNEKTILGFKDNINFITAKINIVKNRISQIDAKIANLKKEINKHNLLIQTDTENMITQFDSDISKINIDYFSVDRMIENLKIKRKKLLHEIDVQTKSRYEIITDLHTYISSYSKELGIDEKYVRSNKDYIFTSDLKSLSGAIFHKLVFSFKLGYIKILEKYSNINVPIILDSPRGKEVDDINIDKMIDILKRDFSNHQIIIASIYTYNVQDVNLIELKKSLLENMTQIRNDI